MWIKLLTSKLFIICFYFESVHGISLRCYDCYSDCRKNNKTVSCSDNLDDAKGYKALGEFIPSFVPPRSQNKSTTYECLTVVGKNPEDLIKTCIPRGQSICLHEKFREGDYICYTCHDERCNSQPFGELDPEIVASMVQIDEEEDESATESHGSYERRVAMNIFFTAILLCAAFIWVAIWVLAYKMC